MSGVAVGFVPRIEPLEPTGVVASGPVARALAQRVLQWPDDRLATLSGIANAEVVLLLGGSDSLPWVDGVDYLGVDPNAPQLLLPTRLRPDAPIDAFERAILRHARGADAPIALLLDPRRLVSVAHARRVSRGRLQAWMAALP